MRKRSRLLVVLAWIPLLTWCGGGGGGSGTDPGSDPGDEVAPDVPADLPTDLPADLPVDLPADLPTPQTALRVTVLTLQGAPLAGASVTLGEQALTTDAAGVARFDDVAAGRVVARVTKAGYAPSTAVVDLGPGLDAKAAVFLLALGTPLTFKAEDGAALVQGRVRVEIPPGALVDAAGALVTGNVDLTIAGLDPTSGDVVAAPGPFEGLATGGAAPVALKSVYLAEISLSAVGQPVQLAVGKKATVEFALPESLQDAYEPGDTIDAWWYDLEAGLWRQEGQGTVKAGAAPGAPKVWSAQVGHFTWWNADQAYTEDNCVQVTVVRSEGAAPLPGLQVRAEGAYGSSDGITDGQGQVCLEFAKGETSFVYVDVGAGHQGASAEVQGWAAAAGCDGQGDPCKQVTLTLQACTDAAGCAHDDPCTTASCDQDQLGVGVCLYAEAPCDDDDPCTDDSCNAEGQCRNVNRCDDGNPCTTDHCLPQGCLHIPAQEGLCDPALGCVADADCEDNQPCTITECVDGACKVTTLEPPCLEPCATDAACATELPCADGVCLAFVGCYLAARTCYDGDDCTLDACSAANGCTHTPIEGCECAFHDHQACCGADICWFDSCGANEGIATDCTGGDLCQMALSGPFCKPCAPVCPADWCGDDSCEGTCACTGVKVCNAQTHQCETPCVAECGARECGPDPVCGQSCGTCSGEKPDCNLATGMCENGACTPDGTTHQGCCYVGSPVVPLAPLAQANNAICNFDSCDVQGTTVQLCGGLVGGAAVCFDPAGEVGPSCCNTTCISMDPTGPGAKCGVGDGCGGTCTCPAGKTCNASTNLCVACTAQCSGKTCGADDTCGGTCLGTCPAGEACDTATHTCKCAPTCAADAACGDSDGCTGTCAGSCPSGQVCNATSHVCEAYQTQCALFMACAAPCGTTNTACLMACYQKYPGEVTKAQALGTCLQTACGAIPTMECSADAVADGGSCKTVYDACFVCTPASCAGKECGNAGCAVTCGTCDPGDKCLASGLCCTPDCAGKVCGDDGCGGSCGPCPTGTACNALSGQCEALNACEGAACGASDGTVAGKCYGWCANAAQECVNKECITCGCYGTPTCCDGGTALCHTCEGCGGSMKLPCSGGCTETEMGAKCLDCTNKQCGDDGSGNPNACGTCGPYESCIYDAYCQPLG